MRCGKWIVGLCVGGWMILSLSGCVSLDKHRRLAALNRNLQAEKQALQQELFDTRSNDDTLRVRADSLEHELAIKNELLANVLDENELLEEFRKEARARLDEMANRPLGDISIAAPKLPEQLDNALKQFADQHPTAVTYDPMRGTMKWKSDLLFALGSDVVRESSMESLRGFSEVINSPAATDFEVIVVGHTDNKPISKPKTKEKHPTNWHLSTHRAIAVGSVLLKNAYAPERVAVMGCGEYRPVADNGTREGNSQNRRVEIYLVPRGVIVSAATK